MSSESVGVIDERVAYAAYTLIYVALYLIILAQRPPERTRADWHDIVTIIMVGVPLTFAAVILVFGILLS